MAQKDIQERISDGKLSKPMYNSPDHSTRSWTSKSWPTTLKKQICMLNNTLPIHDPTLLELATVHGNLIPAKTLHGIH